MKAEIVTKVQNLSKEQWQQILRASSLGSGNERVVDLRTYAKYVFAHTYWCSDIELEVVARTSGLRIAVLSNSLSEPAVQVHNDSSAGKVIFLVHTGKHYQLAYRTIANDTHRAQFQFTAAEYEQALHAIKRAAMRVLYPLSPQLHHPIVPHHPPPYKHYAKEAPVQSTAAPAATAAATASSAAASPPTNGSSAIASAGPMRVKWHRIHRCKRLAAMIRVSQRLRSIEQLQKALTDEQINIHSLISSYSHALRGSRTVFVECNTAVGLQEVLKAGEEAVKRAKECDQKRIPPPFVLDICAVQDDAVRPAPRASGKQEHEDSDSDDEQQFFSSSSSPYASANPYGALGRKKRIDRNELRPVQQRVHFRGGSDASSEEHDSSASDDDADSEDSALHAPKAQRKPKRKPKARKSGSSSEQHGAPKSSNEAVNEYVSHSGFVPRPKRGRSRLPSAREVHKSEERNRKIDAVNSATPKSKRKNAIDSEPERDVEPWQKQKRKPGRSRSRSRGKQQHAVSSGSRTGKPSDGGASAAHAKPRNRDKSKGKGKRSERGGSSSGK
jgi:hypothetical protein